MGIAAVAVAKHQPPRLTFSADVLANPDPQGCMGQVGVYTDLSANLTKPPKSKAEYERIARANTPTNARLRVGSTAYPLSLNRSTSLIGNQQIIWSFRPVKISATTATMLIGNHATMNYTVGGRTVTTRTTTIQDGRCKSLI
jgi:hypothetical protein